jgi:hypothetical protein
MRLLIEYQLFMINMWRMWLKTVTKTCRKTYCFILLDLKKVRNLHHKPKTIFFTLEIVPIGNQ